MEDILQRICRAVWGPGLLALLLGTGALCTLRLRFVQLRFFRGMNLKSGGGLSQAGTVCLSLGAAMGTGNITGVAAALAAGGPGAIFWMWVSAFLGMALVYAENELSVRYSDSRRKGPMAYLEKGLGSRALAGIFAVFCMAAAFGMGGMVQVSSFAEALALPCLSGRFLLAGAVFGVVFFVISGGAKRSGKAAQLLLPIASAIYVIVCGIVIFRQRERLPGAFRSIFSCAPGLRQVSGGALGCAVSVGIRRGIFSNEAGLGSSPILHSAAESSAPGQQGCWSMFEVFFDTIFCCTLTALTLLCAGASSPESAFALVLGKAAAPLVSAELAVFAFCTMIGWYYCGETACRYLFPECRTAVPRLIFAIASASGAVISLRSVWALSDIFNGLMALPNLCGIILLLRKLPRE